MSEYAEGINLANSIIEKAKEQGSSTTEFEHKSGKWYKLIIEFSGDSPNTFTTTRKYGGVQGRPDTSMKRQETADAVTKIVTDRVTHGYKVV